MLRKIFICLGIVSLLTLSGCAQMMQINNTIDSYARVANQISLGDSKEKVLAILAPLQRDLPLRERKAPETYIKGGNTYYIYYMRSSVINDGITTDDEFTPYQFKNDKLISIGWTALGGPKTVGHPTPIRDIQHCIPDGFGGVTCF